MAQELLRRLEAGAACYKGLVTWQMHPDVAPAAWVLLAVLVEEPSELARAVAQRFPDQARPRRGARGAVGAVRAALREDASGSKDDATAVRLETL